MSGSILRQSAALHATIQLVDTRRNRVDWGSRYEIDPSDVGGSANQLARELSARLGLTSRPMYEYFRYEGGTAAMASWPGLPATIAALRSHDVRRGLALTESLLVRFPRAPEAHVMRLVTLVDQDNAQGGTLGARQAVIAALDALELLDPDHPVVPVTRASYWGNADFETNEATTADVVLTRVLARQDLRPGLRSQALRYRAKARANSAKPKEAMRDMEEAIRQDPANPYNYAFLAELLSEDGRHAEALQRFREAAAIDPGFDNIGLVDFMERAGQVELALERSAELCRTKPGAGNWSFRARLLAEHGYWGEARQAIARAREYPENGLTLYDLARTWGILGEHPQSLEALARAIRLGFRSTGLDSDSAFVRLWRDPAFLRLVDRARPDSTDLPRT